MTMSEKLNSYTVDFQHRVIILRPEKGPEKRIEYRTLVEKLTAQAEQHVAKHHDLAKAVPGEIENRIRDLRRGMPALQAQSPEWWAAKREIERLEKVDMQKMIELRRNQLVSETAKRLAHEQMDDWLQALQPRALETA